MRPLKVALIGCGFIGRFHSIAIRSINRLGLLDVSCTAVCDRDESRARSFASAAGVPLVSNQPSEITGSPDVDIVYVCVPTSAHKEIVLRAAGRGKHIFCEKPLAPVLADVEEMVAAVEAAGVKAGAGLVLRHSPILNVLKSLTEDTTLGRLMVAVLRDDQFFPVHGDPRKERDAAGSGALLERSIHDVDALRWLAGEVTSVRGTVRNFAGHEGVEDLALAHLQFGSGAQGQLSSIWHSVLGRPSSRRLELFFEKGAFFIDNDFLGPIHVQTHAMPAEVIPEDEVRRRYMRAVGLPGNVFDALLRYSLEDYLFLKAIAEGSDPFPDFHTALEAHRLVDAIYRSAGAGGAEVFL